MFSFFVKLLKRKIVNTEYFVYGENQICILKNAEKHIYEALKVYNDELKIHYVLVSPLSSTCFFRINKLLACLSKLKLIVLETEEQMVCKEQTFFSA